MIRVIKGKVKFNGVYYGVGDVISGLSEQDEARLVKNGMAEYVKEKKASKQEPPPPQNKLEPEPKPEEEAVEPVDEKINFDPDECIVIDADTNPAPKKTAPRKPTSTRKPGKK